MTCELLPVSTIPYSATLLAGRPVTISTVRVRHTNKQHGWYNRINIRFHDTGEFFSMGAAQYTKWATKLEREAASKLVQS